MHTIVVGLNHKTADVEIREKCYFSQSQLQDTYTKLLSNPILKGAVIISTCNRVEIYASTNSVEESYDYIAQFLSNYHSLPLEKILPYLYSKRCHYATNHLFKVIAGLDSMVLGEYQIQGQVRDAYQLAYSLECTDGYLNKLFQSAINIGKKVRNQTSFAKDSLSVAQLAIDIITETSISKDKQLQILLVGAGTIAELTIKELVEAFDCSITICNRTFDKAAELAKSLNCNVIHYAHRYLHIRSFDIIITATGAEHYTLEYTPLLEELEQDLEHKRTFIDLSVPRNIDPQIQEIKNCKLYSIDDIHKKTGNHSLHQIEIIKAEEVIGEMAIDYYNWYNKQVVMPIMKNIKHQLDILKEKSFDIHKTDIEGMNIQQQHVSKQILDTYSEKLIKTIMQNLSNIVSKEEVIHIMDALQTSFSLDFTQDNKPENMHHK